MPALAPHVNYIACFLTFECPYRCWFCINRNSRLAQRPLRSGAEWIDFINRHESTTPYTLQGGEPTCHPDFYDIVNRTMQPIDLLTNLTFDVEEFIARADPKRFYRHAPFAPIRISYYDNEVSFEEFLGKCLRLREGGFDFFVFSLDFPDSPPERASDLKSKFAQHQIEHRMKPFLGIYKGKLHPEGVFLSDDAITRKSRRRCQCRTSEILIAPDGQMFRCHADLYENVNPIADISAPEEALQFKHRACDRYGYCNPCDLKVKNNRLEQFGHCAVDIIDISS